MVSRSAQSSREAEISAEGGAGLAAYYWTGAAPAAHNIKDISSSGLYVVTEERWYPGTLVMMTLQKTSDGEESVEKFPLGALPCGSLGQ